MSKHIVVKWQNIKNREKTLKAARKKGQITLKRQFKRQLTSQQRIVDGGRQTIKGENSCQSRFAYSAKVSFKNTGKYFQETNLRAFTTKKTILKKNL